jgi:tripartite-type tricarboxylate transporter receptor subunit TctC
LRDDLSGSPIKQDESPPVLFDYFYDPVRDLAPVSLVVNNVEMLVVNPNNPVNGPQEFITAAQAAHASAGAAAAQSIALREFCLALMNTTEFIYSN